MIGYLLIGASFHVFSLFLIFTRHLEDGQFIYIPKVNNDNQIFPVCLQVQIQTILYLLSLSGYFNIYKNFFPSVANASISLLVLFILENRTQNVIMTLIFLIPVVGNIIILQLLPIQFPRSRQGETIKNVAMAVIHYLNFAQYKGTGTPLEFVGFSVFQLGVMEIGTWVSSFVISKFDKRGVEEEAPPPVKSPHDFDDEETPLKQRRSSRKKSKGKAN